MIPFYLWNAAYGLATTLLRYVGINFGQAVSFDTLVLTPLWNAHVFMLNCATWYVPPHFLVQCISFIPCKYLQNRGFLLHSIYLAITLALSASGVYLSLSGYPRKYHWLILLVKVTTLLPVYTVGLIYKRFLEQKDTLRNDYYFLIHSGLTLAVSLIGGQIKGYWLWSCLSFPNLYQPLFYPYLGIGFWLRIPQMLEPV